MRSYIVWAPPFDRSCGGVVALQRLAVELQKRGMNVFMNTEHQNPKWPEVSIYRAGLVDYDDIAIYPEVLSGNPFMVKTVIRYLLNIPGACSPDYSSTWGEKDLFYTYSRLFNTKLGLPDDRVLLTPHIDLNVFYDKHLPRNGRMKYRGKGQQPEDKRLSGYPLLGHKEGFRGDDGQAMVAEALNRCEEIFIYDNATAMTEIARLCGCPIVIIPDGQYTKQDYMQHEFYGGGGIGWGIEESAIARTTINSELMRAEYEKAEEEFQKKLTEFIRVTQGV